jgi:hypothetical protein
MDDRPQLAGAVGLRANGLGGGDVDLGGAAVEAGDAQGVGGGPGRVLVKVGQQDGVADADAASDRLADGAGADDDDYFVGWRWSWHASFSVGQRCGV